MSSALPETIQMAQFALTKQWSDLAAIDIEQLKKHLLDSLASLIHCIERPTIKKLAKSIAALSAGGQLQVPALGKLTYDRAAQYYTALIRYPDFMDNFLGKEATCHPSDNIGPLLAAANMEDITGQEFLLAMAIAYEIECRLIEEIPVMVKGFDHTLLLAYSVTAGLCRILQLDEQQTSNALSIAGCSLNPLVASRASYTYEWKGLQSSLVALGCFNIVMMAKEGMTGPIRLFEGPKGFEKEFDMKLDYDWSQDGFDLLRKCILKSYNAEVHTQSLIEAALEIREEQKFNPSEIKEVEAITFLTAYHIVGGGEYGDRTDVHSKEQADHSLPYVLSAALIDGDLYPEQLLPGRINKDDVQQLLKKVKISTKFSLHKPVKIAGFLDPYTEAYPGKLIGKLTVKLNNGEEYTREKEDYKGFHTRPLTWSDVESKFRRLTSAIINEKTQQKIINLVKGFESANASDLTKLLGSIGKKDDEKKEKEKMKKAG
jgi:2-methylcitrate dehydratase